MKRTLMFGVTVVVLALFFGPGAAKALDFNFSGNFMYDNDVVLMNFTVGAASTVTVFSSSWLSGEPPHGFDPVLCIWSSGGGLLAFQDDGHNIGSTFSNGIEYFHGDWDSYYGVDLPSGNYIASITQYDNFNVGPLLSNGFRYDGNPNFTFDNLYGPQDYFNGVWNDDYDDPRTSAWQFHLLNVVQADVPGIPEPTTFVLLGLALLGLAGRRFRRTT